MRLALRHLDAWSGLVGQLAGQDGFVDTASAWRGAVTLVVWVVAAVVAWRHGPPALRSLHVVVGVGLAARRRVDGPDLRAAVVLPHAVGLGRDGIAGSAPCCGQLSSGCAASARTGTLRTASAYAGAGSSPWSSSVADRSRVRCDAEHPEERLSAAVGALAGPTYDAVVDAVGEATGADGRYLVRWSDAADIGSPGYGLLDELERRGLDVAADD